MEGGMPGVSERDLCCFMLRGYHAFDEPLPSAWIAEMNAVIDEMNAREFDASAYPNTRVEPRYDDNGSLGQVVVRNILEVDPVFRDLIDLDCVLP